MSNILTWRNYLNTYLGSYEYKLTITYLKIKKRLNVHTNIYIFLKDFEMDFLSVTYYFHMYSLFRSTKNGQKCTCKFPVNTHLQYANFQYFFDAFLRRVLGLTNEQLKAKRECSRGFYIFTLQGTQNYETGPSFVSKHLEKEIINIITNTRQHYL